MRESTGEKAEYGKGVEVLKWCWDRLQPFMEQPGKSL